MSIDDARGYMCRYLGSVCKDGNLHDAKTTFLARRLDPCQVGLFSVTGGCNQLAVELLKLLRPFAECNDLCWTYKCEILRRSSV